MSTQLRTKIASAVATSDGLSVMFAGISEPETFSWFWLYDHSEDPSRYNTESSQRKINTFKIDKDIAGTSIELNDGDQVVVKWSDGSAPGLYSVELLAGAAGIGTGATRSEQHLCGNPPMTIQRAQHADRELPLAVHKL